MDIAITKISSKGQIVIPQEMREGLNEGDKLLIIRNDEGQIILKRASDFDKTLKIDLDFAKKTDVALKRYEKGNFKSVESTKFLEMLKKC